MLTIHEAQTAILIWLWENDHPIFDGEAMATACEDDGPWQLTLRGFEQLDLYG